MAQKIIKIGSSQGITLQKETLQHAGLGMGDFVRVEIAKTKKGNIITIHPDTSISPNPELSDWTKRFIKKHRTSLEALSKK